MQACRQARKRLPCTQPGPPPQGNTLRPVPPSSSVRARRCDNAAFPDLHRTPRDSRYRRRRFPSARTCARLAGSQRRAGDQPDALTHAWESRDARAAGGRRAPPFVHGDICDRAPVERLFAEHRPRAVVHFAAESHVDRSIHGPALRAHPTSTAPSRCSKPRARTGRALPTGEREAFRSCT